MEARKLGEEFGRAFRLKRFHFLRMLVQAVEGAVLGERRKPGLGSEDERKGAVGPVLEHRPTAFPSAWAAAAHVRAHLLALDRKAHELAVVLIC